MPDHGSLWGIKARALAKARRAFREGKPEGLHDLRVALRRISATASALGRERLSRRSRKLARALSSLRQLEVDRQLLTRVRDRGLLSPDVAVGLDARWDALLQARQKAAGRVLKGKAMRRLARKLSRLTRKKDLDVLMRLEETRRRAERDLVSLRAQPTDRELHRYRLAVKRARYLAESLVLAGTPGMEEAVAREKQLQDALGRWNDIRLFRQRLRETREEAESRGAVTLALELDHLLPVLDRTLVSIRATALEAARGMSNVVSLTKRTA